MPSRNERQTALVQQIIVQPIVRLRGFLLGLAADFRRVGLVRESFLSSVEKIANFREGTES